MKTIINRIIASLCFLIALLLYFRGEIRDSWPWILIAVFLGLLHLMLSRSSIPQKEENEFVSQHRIAQAPKNTLIELVLLSENHDHLASWNIYGKNGVVIGRDVGENQVTVNLDNTTYASMIDIEHAVLNYAGNDWYVEDISNRNGVSVQKKDGKKYKLSYGKPCKLERGDIIYIALTKLMIL